METYFISYITNCGEAGNVIVDIISGLRGRMLFEALDEALSRHLDDDDIKCESAEIMYFREL